ncbi:PadR family transcriptional regulator [Paenibacillus sp. OAS669]|uniref:PadR family transcriptional regulator n=1 Tax=Paenibacillus sp. OAS669 TaxID=2663821 RepID=UPI0017891566|nr:PadR family transcriptional regulator [Paenibacillus sp. OAS669]MBE1446791.1 DNA-binding PadR family transcriptional regulator [Paenibacillus sp. OAS669]
MTGQDAILGLLMRKSMSGYDIKQQFEELLSYFFDASFGTIYPTLSKMEKEELITKESIEQQGKPNKNVYTITEKGKAQFHSYLESKLQDNVLRSDFMVRMFFGQFADSELIQSWMEEAILREEAHLVRLKKDYDRFGKYMTPTQEICIQIGIASAESNLKIVKEGLAKIRQTEQGERPATNQIEEE